MTEHRVVLILGSNRGERSYYIEQALQRISDQVGEIIKLSRVYETDAVGYESKHRYLNQALLVESPLNPEELIAVTQKIEKELGRTRSLTERYTDRTIDIDILFYDDLVLKTENLIIPHPEISKREFVLQPLMDIIPHYKHPATGESVEQMWKKVKNISIDC